MPRRPSGATRRRHLVEKLEASGALGERAVRRAFLVVPRERFLPGRALDEVYEDKAIVTRHDASGAPTSSSSQPSIMALMLDRLELTPGMRVLEIGAGTGYNAALLSTVVGDAGQVTSVEVEPDLARAAAAALAEGGYGATVVTGDGREGWPPGAPYDRIVVTASTDAVYRPWFDQLRPGGLLELPLQVKGFDVQVVVTLRKEGGRLRSTAAVDGGFMMLRDPDAAPKGYVGSSVTVTDHADGRRRSLGALSGRDLRRLNPSARRRLAALMLTEPRTRRLGRASGSATLWLLLARPRGAIVARYFRSDLGKHSHGAAAVAAVDGRSLALAVGTRMESYGDGRADDALSALLAQWRHAGRPATEDLDVTVRYRDDGSPRLTFGWRAPSTVRSRR
ncbi:MAG: methyltransferase domain-containing protein [Actinomycetota bacterium]|nr:methyltransferase domain-containing protein [Actinomycetota bacterium]